MLVTAEADLLWDLRIQNDGRPEEYEEYLEKVQQFIERSVETSVQERRHDDITEDGESVSYMATSLSAADLYRSVNKELEDPNVKIPSMQWLRWKFWPSRKNSANAKLKVKYMIQGRQLLKTHVDSYYCPAHFRYLKEYTIKYRNETNLVFQADNHTVKIGEPSYPVAAIERGNAVLVSTDKMFVASDHDFTKTTFTPTVLLHSKIPEDLSEGFYQGDMLLLKKTHSNIHRPYVIVLKILKLLTGCLSNR